MIRVLSLGVPNDQRFNIPFATCFGTAARLEFGGEFGVKLRPRYHSFWVSVLQVWALAFVDFAQSICVY